MRRFRFEARDLLALALVLLVACLAAACGTDSASPDACVPGSLACPCADAGRCAGALVCDTDARVCRESSDCKSLGCGTAQRCGIPDGGLERECLPLCEPGFTWVERMGRCVPELPQCSDAAMKTKCDADHHMCVMAQDGPLCAGCAAGYIESQKGCVAVKSCADLDCAARKRSCSPAGDHRNAECGACEPGTRELDGVCKTEVCDPVPPSGTVRASCADEMQVCIDGRDGVSCGGCWPGYVREDGECRAARTCVELGCATQERVCKPAAGNADAACGACRAGFTDVASQCTPVSGATCAAGAGSIADACAKEHRTCTSTPNGASCGDCADGYVFDLSAGACVSKVLCASLNCVAQHRACEDFPNGHCTACAPGYTEDPENGSCRPVGTCASLKCAAPSVCVEGASAEGDAACVPDCGKDAVWNGLRCEACPPCDRDGETGRWPTPTRSGYCICGTKPGYFYSTAGDVGTVKCDADGDGWARESARLAVSSDDRVLAENARCDVRQIDRFVLENDRGQTHEELLAEPLPLYESDRNDDDGLLAASFAARGLPPRIGDDANARLPKAAELNRLTKICHHVRADYNDNGSFDVSEWGDQPLAPVLSNAQAPFNRFSYFAELHQGYYEPPTSGRAFGQYRIIERTRPAASGPVPAGALPLTYTAADGDTWRTCDRERDALYGDQSVLPVGLDLAAQYAPPASPYVILQSEWRGMMHHSQFKCLALSNDPSPLVPTARKPNDLADVVLNQCSLDEPGAPLGQGANPKDPPFTCGTVASSDAKVAAGNVLWGAVRYRDHGTWGAPVDEREYVRGCRNGCYAALSSCPGFATNPDAVVCTYDAADFGRFVSCDVAEICDGIDNDENPGTVDGSGDPQLNTSCVPKGQLGSCLEGGGITQCGASAPWLYCQPLVSALPDELYCDGHDEDCNGQVDDGDPGNDGSACTPSDGELTAAGVPADAHFGECMKGQRGACVNGANQCTVLHTPVAEICGNGLDDDCDGNIDESELLSADGLTVLGKYGATTQPGCVDYQRDLDGDNFGAALEKLCLCKPANATTFHSQFAPNATLPGTYVYRSDTQSDCCDKSNSTVAASIFPGAGGWLDALGPCGNFDKNCNGVDQQEYTASGIRACGDDGVCGSGDICCQTRACQAPTVGWDGSVPACGITGTYITGGCGCKTSGIACGDPHTEQRLQRCH